MIYFQWQLTTLLQNFINLFSVELIFYALCKKYKMVAVAMLNFIFVQFHGM